MFQSILKNAGRIVLILLVAGVIVAALSALTSSSGQTPAFNGNFVAGRLERAGGHEEGGSAFGMLELVKNVGVMGVIITAYWFLQKWFDQTKRRIRVAA